MEFPDKNTIKLDTVESKLDEIRKLKTDLNDLEEDKRRNFEERLKFIDLLVDHIKSLPDEQ